MNLPLAFVYLTGFDVAEVGADSAQTLWQRGGFPRAFLAAGDATSYAWRQEYIETFLSRDAARFGITLAPEGLRRFDLDEKITALPVAHLSEPFL